jgi:hypothetical protein
MKTKTKQQSVPPPVAGGSTNESVPGAVATGALPQQEKAPVTSVPGTDNDDTGVVAQLQAENEQLKATIRFDAAHRQLTGELARAGARSPELLFDAVKDELQFADDGTLENAAAIVDKLKTSFPEQFGADRPASIDAGSGQVVLPRLTRDALHRMSAAEIAELDWNDVRRVLAG